MCVVCVRPCACRFNLLSLAVRLVSFSAGHGVVSIAGFCFLVVLLFLLLHITFGFAADVVLMAVPFFFSFFPVASYITYII